MNGASTERRFVMSGAPIKLCVCKRDRVGAVLFELLVALAIFVVAATTLLGTFGDVVASIDRDTTTARAVDLARTRMSELEVGLLTIEDLRADSERVESRGDQGLTLEATVSRSAYPGLSLVELRVFDARRDEPRFTLRQLVAMPRDRALDANSEMLTDEPGVSEVTP